MRSLGTRMREVGRDMVIAGAALAIPGIAALKLALDFDTSMTRIITLVGIAREEVDKMREGVLELSAETAQAPQALAEALFVVTSAGARGAEAMEILEAAAKGSAVGLGQTEVIARAVVAAVTAFRKQGLSAAEATDILTATVREGNLEAASLAGSLSRVLAPAAELGVAFSDVGAFIATFSRTGGDASEAATALRSTFIALLKPTTDAQKAMAETGLSAEELRTQLREEGLVRTLITLKDAFDGNAEGLARVVPNVRALTGVLTTVGAQEEEFLRITDSLAESQGILADAFEIVAGTPAFKLQEALNDIRVELTKIGLDLLPVATRIISVVSSIVGAFSALPGPIKTAALGAGLLGGALLVLAGTAAIVAGSIIAIVPALNTMQAAMTRVGLATAFAAGPLGIGALAVSLAAAAALFVIFKSRADAAAEAAERSGIIAARAAKLSADELERQVEGQKRLVASIRNFIAETEAAAARGRRASDERRQELERLNDTLQKAEENLNDWTAALTDARNAEEQAAQFAQDAADAIAELGIEADESAAKITRLTAAALSTKLALEVLSEPIFDPGEFEERFEIVVGQIREVVREEERLKGLVEDIINSARESLGLAPLGGVPRPEAAPGAPDLGQPIDINALIADQRRRAISGINEFGRIVVGALRAQRRAELDITLGAIEAERIAIESASDGRLRILRRERDERIRIINEQADAAIGALNDELAALTQEERAEERGDIERRLALAFDAKERAKIEAELRAFDRRARRAAIRDEIRDIEDGRDDEIRAAEDNFAEQDRLRRESLDEAIRLNDLAVESARRSFEQTTSDFALEAEARKLIEQRNQEEIVALIESFAPDWRTAGLTLGEQLVDGVRASIQGTLGTVIADLNRALTLGGGVALGPVDAAKSTEIANLQFLGKKLKGEGAPEFVLNEQRRLLVELGAVPEFQAGTQRGRVQQTGLAILHAGEIVVNPARGQSAGGPSLTFQRGAFDGMFRGATLSGSEADNRRMVADAVNDVIDEQLGRGAFIAGVRTGGR